MLPARAARRAAHLRADAEPDSWAERLHGDRAEELLVCHRLHGTQLVLAGARAQAGCRRRFTEARLTRVNSGIDQYVIPGAGLDSFVHRDAPGRFRVFEVDHPAPRTVKRELRHRRAGFVPVGFEADSLREQLVQSGLSTVPPRVRELARCHRAPDAEGDSRHIDGSRRFCTRDRKS